MNESVVVAPAHFHAAIAKPTATSTWRGELRPLVEAEVARVADADEVVGEPDEPARDDERQHEDAAAREGPVPAEVADEVPEDRRERR